MTNVDNGFDQNQIFLQGMSLIHEVEQNAPVSRWKFKGLHIWPIFKYVLVKQLILSMQRGFSSSDKLDGHQKFVNMHPAKRYDFETFQCFFDDASWQSKQLLSSKVLFLANSSSFTRNADAAISHHHDHLRLELERNDITSAAFIQNADKVPGGLDAALLGNSYEFDSFIKFIGQTATLPTGLVENFCDQHFPKFSDFSAIIGIPTASLAALTHTLLGRTALSVKHLKWLFRKMPLKAVFSGNYASFFGWATAYVCRKRRIPFIDLQHGFQGRLNGSYHWYGTPRSDWTVIPSRQFNYTSSDKHLFEAAHSKRKGIVVGPSWAQYDDLMESGDIANQAFQSEQSAYREKKFQFNKYVKTLKKPVVLFAAQNADDIVNIASLAESFHGTILCRNHPTKRNMGLDLISDRAADNLHVNQATHTPLPIVLANVDAVVTGYSALLLEATGYSIPCLASSAFVDLLKDDYGENFEKLVHVENGLNSDFSAIIENRIESSIEVDSQQNYLTAAQALKELHLIN